MIVDDRESGVTDLREKYRSSGPAPCPGCGSRQALKRKRKGSIIIFLFLLSIGVLPGLVYGIIYDGYEFVCPACGMKRGDAK
jgi:hypothetical protein